MHIPKPTDADKTKFRSLVPDNPAVEVKPMFGNLGAFVNGNMFMGLFGTDIGVKLDESGQHELKKAGGLPFGPSERPMSGYVSLPVGFTTAQSAPWIARAFEYVSAQPTKTPRAKTK